MRSVWFDVFVFIYIPCRVTAGTVLREKINCFHWFITYCIRLHISPVQRSRSNTCYMRISIFHLNQYQLNFGPRVGRGTSFKHNHGSASTWPGENPQSLDPMLKGNRRGDGNLLRASGKMGWPLYYQPMVLKLYCTCLCAYMIMRVYVYAQACWTWCLRIANSCLFYTSSRHVILIHVFFHRVNLSPIFTLLLALFWSPPTPEGNIFFFSC